MFGTPILREQFEASLLPRRKCGKAEPARNDSIDFAPQHELVESDLLLFSQPADGFIADAEDRGSRYRVFVILDFALHVQLILVLERTVLLMRHEPVGKYEHQ
jgi:hypothetical protein